MNGSGGDSLGYAEALLREGDREAALPVLREYVRQYPRSARGWWMLGLAVNDPREQVDCLERVLDINPGYAPAQVYLEKFRQKTGVAPAPVWEPAPPPAVRIAPPSPPVPHSTPQRAPAKKQAWLVPAVAGGLALLLMLFCGVGMFVFLSLPKDSVPVAPQPLLPTRTLHPTWTPTLTVTPRPTLTPIPSFTPLPPLSLLDGQGMGNNGPAFGSPSIDFTLNSVDGERVSLSSYLGRPVLLFFWASWCPYCRNEVAALKDLHTAYKDQGLVILAIQVAEPAATGRTFRENHDLDFLILSDTSGSVFRGYSSQGAIPLNYFIDANGKINYSQLGTMDYTSLNLRARALLNLIPTAVP